MIFLVSFGAANAGGCFNDDGTAEVIKSAPLEIADFGDALFVEGEMGLDDLILILGFVFAVDMERETARGATILEMAFLALSLVACFDDLGLAIVEEEPAIEVEELAIEEGSEVDAIPRSEADAIPPIDFFIFFNCPADRILREFVGESFLAFFSFD